MLREVEGAHTKEKQIKWKKIEYKEEPKHEARREARREERDEPKIEARALSFIAKNPEKIRE